MKKYITLLAFILSFGSSLLAQNKSEDEAKIKALLLKEVDALNKTQNLDEYMACFAPTEEIVFGPQKDHLIIGVSELRPFAEKIIANYKKNPNSNTWKFSDWKIRINGRSAFVTCLQTTTTPKGSQILVFKSDYLEKFYGDWKIVDHRFYHTAEMEPRKID